MEQMTVSKIFEMEIVGDNTEIFIRRNEGFDILAHGNWFLDDVLTYTGHEVKSFTWQDNNEVYIDVIC